MASLRGIIFDIDGTLVDSNDQHAQAWCDALSEFGYQVPYETIRPLIGMGSDKLLPRAVGIDGKSELAKTMGVRRSAIFKERYLPHLLPCPGAHDLLVQLDVRGLKMVVATSAQKNEVNDLLAIVNGNKFFAGKTTSSDADRSKPDPDIVTVALEKIGFAPDEVFMVGDTPYDIEAAGRAKIGTIALRCGGWDDKRLSGAIAVFDDPADLAQNLDRMLGPGGVTAWSGQLR
ncbi:MAG TPA: HAD family hydrolase [Pirellulales bacterium]|nr:HAD family hydrolase [Pirellulales bacterium]